MLLIKYQLILCIYSYISFNLVHSFIWLGKWVNLSPHLVQSSHYVGGMIFKLVCSCFSKIENIKLSISWLICLVSIWRCEQIVNLAMYPERIWNICRWPFNLWVHRCERHCWIVFLFTFSVAICFSCIPWDPLDRRLGGLQGQSGRSGEQKNICSCR
jgi:hypothetical protein